MEKLLLQKGLKNVYDFLSDIDPHYAKNKFNDKLRIIRALEVFYETKKNLSYFHKKRIENNKFDFLKCFWHLLKKQ